MSENRTGSCLCKTIKYEIDARPVMAANCHCGICKKNTGAAFQSVIVVKKENFKITEGEDALNVYQVSDNAIKQFCSTCGSPIYNDHKAFPETLMVMVGSLDDPQVVRPAMNVFCENMLPWVPKIGQLRNFKQFPPQG